MKTCSKCGRDKDQSQFDKDARTKDGLQYLCKDCRRSYQNTRNQGMDICDLCFDLRQGAPIPGGCRPDACPKRVTKERCKTCLKRFRGRCSTSCPDYPPTHRRTGVWTLRGLTRPQLGALWQSQNGNCACCGRGPLGMHPGFSSEQLDARRAWQAGDAEFPAIEQARDEVCLDFDRTTGIARAYVCHGCMRAVRAYELRPHGITGPVYPNRCVVCGLRCRGDICHTCERNRESDETIEKYLKGR